MAVNVVLLRAAQEAGANVRKHADARAVDMVLRYGAGQVGIRVADDGNGFDGVAASTAEGDAERGAPGQGQGQGPGDGGGFGLRGMAARVAEIGGVMNVVSEPGAGTAVEVQVPLEEAADEER